MALCSQERRVVYFIFLCGNGLFPPPNPPPPPPLMSPSSGHLGNHRQRASIHPKCRDRHHWVPTSQHPFSVVQRPSLVPSAIRSAVASQWRKSLFTQSPLRSERTPRRQLSSRSASPQTNNSPAGVSRTSIPDDPGG